MVNCNCNNIPIRSVNSRELRGGILYTDCFCLRRNGLQYDCRRSGCQSSPLCSVTPAPLCETSRETCVKYSTNPYAEAITAICNMRPKLTQCSPCGPMVCYKYEDCGPPLCCLPRSAFKRNGLQDHQYFQQGSVRYLCRSGPGCCRPCPPRCPPCVRRPPPGKTYNARSNGGPQGHHGQAGAEEGGKKEKDIQLKRIKSRELRGGVMYYSCHCIKRNGLQHDCRRTGCGGEPACLTLPDPVCAPSQLARARGLADPAALAAHHAQQGGGSGSHGAGPSGASGSGAGKRFIVCELKGIAPDASANKSEKCCKCNTNNNAPFNSNIQTPPIGCCSSSKAPAQGSVGRCRPVVPAQYMTVGKFSGSACISNPARGQQALQGHSRCPCVKPLQHTRNDKCGCSGAANAGKPLDARTTIVFDEQMTKNILSYFGKQDLVTGVSGEPTPRNRAPPLKKSEPCTRPGCVHWQPPPPCVWDMPCKADCFEAPAGIQPGRNPWAHGSGPCVMEKSGPQRLVDVVNKQSGYHPQAVGYGSTPSEAIKCMTPKCCTGCCVSSDGGAAGGGKAADMPVLLMKLC